MPAPPRARSDDPSGAAARRAHWDTMAQQWRFHGPPLRPCAADIHIMQRAVAAHAERCPQRPLHAFLLGVTPEIAEMRWPPRTQLLAVDRSAEMLKWVWPGDCPGRRAACTDWFSALSTCGPFAVVIGDGSPVNLLYPQEWRTLAQVARDALAGGGILVIRFFVLPAALEAPAQVLSDLAEGRIGSFHVFKFRLAMSLQQEPGAGVSLDTIWRCWNDAGIDEHRLQSASGWPLEAIRTIQLYRGKLVKLTFPTLEQAQDTFVAGWDVEFNATPDYEMGDRCPLFVFRRR